MGPRGTDTSVTRSGVGPGRSGQGEPPWCTGMCEKTGVSSDTPVTDRRRVNTQKVRTTRVDVESGGILGALDDGVKDLET